jgi:TPR repeat protein
MREAERRLIESCPFCREPTPSTVEASDKQRMKRIEANDPVALCEEGVKQYVKADCSSAFEYFTRAAELGDVEAHNSLSYMYRDGHGVEKDRGKAIYHLEEAAIGGHPDARFNLGCEEEESGNIERAVKHWIIAAKLGLDESLETLKDAFGKGYVSKDDFAAALRAHQAAVDATKSPQREAEELAREELRGFFH